MELVKSEREDMELLNVGFVIYIKLNWICWSAKTTSSQIFCDTDKVKEMDLVTGSL